MHNYYIINGIIEFHPATSTLRTLDNQNNVVVLNSPAGRCLLLLIERMGTIVSQHEFMEIVWAKRGILVSSNTYYQNISILRKGLKKIGLNEDPVVTIPRIGLTLASGTQIEKLTTEHKIEVCHENAHFIDVQSLTEELTASDLLDEKDEDKSGNAAECNDVIPVSANSSSKNSSAKEHFFSSRFIFWGACAVLSVFFVSLIVTYLKMYNTDRYFSSYQFTTSTQDCHIFLSGDIATDDGRFKALSYSEQFKNSCASYPWLYIAHIPLLRRTSVIRCNKPMNEDNTCISDYFLGENK